MIGKPAITNYCITAMQCVPAVVDYGGTVYIVVAAFRYRQDLNQKAVDGSY